MRTAPMGATVESALSSLAERVVACERCPRLRAHCRQVARVKKRAYMEWAYWGKPLPGFGDACARLLILGLAPAAHGGNRTGRMFTGNGSGDWLARALYEARLANQSLSVNRDDGLRLKGAYVTAIIRCAPPGNKPTREEVENCSPYWMEELRLLREVRLVLTLGRVAFDAYLAHLPGGLVAPKPSFRHGATYRLGENTRVLMASYHPSRQNTQTGRLTWEAWTRVFVEVRKALS